MNENDIIKALEEYVFSSSKRETHSQKVRLSELEPYSLKYLESKLRSANSKEILQLEKVILRLDARIDLLEDSDRFEMLIESIVLKKIGWLIAIAAGLAGIVALIVALIGM